MGRHSRVELRARPLLLAALISALAVPTIIFVSSEGGDASPEALPKPFDCAGSLPCPELGIGLDAPTGGTSPAPITPLPSASPTASVTDDPVPSATSRRTPPAPGTAAPRAIRPPLAVAARVVPLTGLANNDGFGVAGGDGGGFDGAGYTYPRTEMPAGRTSIGGVPFDLLGDGDDNVVALGQTVDLPDGRFGALRVLAAASYGPASGTATVRYADGSTRPANLTAPDWTRGGPGVLQADFRVAGPDETQDTETHVYLLSVSLDPARTVTAISLPTTSQPAVRTASLHVFALTLIPPG